MRTPVSHLAGLLCLAFMTTLLPAAPSRARAVAPAGTQQQELTAADAARGHHFGSTVALSADGSTALVGAFNKNGKTGVAYVMRGIRIPEAEPPVTSTAPACLGSHDLIIDGTQIALSGVHTFDQVCIIDGATMLARNLTLRAGVVYLDARSHINADGLPGGPSIESGPDCSPTGNGKPGGDDGSPLTILAHQAIVLGIISSNGGAANMAGCATNYQSGENGGRGGQVTLEAAALSFSGTIAARGGAGGQLLNEHGGNGGTISVLLPAGAVRPHGSFDVSGGQPGTSEHAATLGRLGQAGTVSVASLTAAQLAVLPPAPAAPMRILGQAPARLPLQPAAGFAAALRCGAGDLDVGHGATVRLDGVQRFAHVCIHDGGVLTSRGRLILIASTIAVDARSRISADGVSRTARGPARATGAPPAPARALPPPGTSGVAGTAAGVCCGGTSQPPAGSAGGGAIALIAHTVLLAGSLSAEGAPGRKGDDGFGTPSSCGQGGQGAGGGAGGGIYIRAATLQLSGHISVAGGKGGAGGQDECLTEGTDVADGGSHGAPGLVILLVDTLHAAAGALPIAGPAALGQTLPVDPAPPVNGPGAQYVATIGAGPNATLLGHSLAGPFLAFYRRYGGLPTFGYPRTEPFMEGGHQVQYTERFLLQLVGGAVVTAPLGRALTSGRAYATVAPFAGTPARRFFGATGHSLSGQFLSFWTSHHGATLLGAPISEVVREQNGDGSGRTYPLQWFEKGRLEYHADLAGTPYAVQLGLLGTQALRQRGWLP